MPLFPFLFMDPDLVVIILGLIIIVLVMAFILNPPEAWVKRAFRTGSKTASKRDRPPE